ncbi:hypothetical protein [Emticicia sp. C21]|uniref:hypothetical protein n=1 Tax=Emticicia sp. C21 TaxID=2302915 RepID=UPI000E3500F4|nr:hypothetical protein [Emticicia sp. C21]RFS15977.1 hypothetical protein D0T08_13835 [Emticicia sp. C21]
MKFLDFKGALLKTVFCFSLVLLITDESFAQGGMFSKKNKINQYSSISIGGGSSHYFGDLSPYSTFYYGLYTNVRWNATINYTRQFTPQFAARVSFTWARILGDDYNYSQRNLTKFHTYYLRNLHFRNDIKEFALTGVFNLLPQTGKGQQGRRAFMPYGLLGIGFYGHSPKARENATVDPTTGEVTLGGWLNLKELQTSGQGIIPDQPKSYSLLQPVFPVGLGVKMKLTEKLDLNLEGGLRITPFDYLDDVGSSKYPNPTVLAATSPTGALLSNRAGENISARTGEDRTPVFVQIMTDPAYRYNLAGAGIQPSTNAEQFVGFSANTIRGSSRWDSYFVTQITISYIIGSSVKCPPIK